MICRYRLTGSNEGRSVTVNHCDFLDGCSAWIDRPDEDWEKLDRQMTRFYGCVREEHDDGGINDEGSAALQPNGSGAASASASESELDADPEDGGAGSETPAPDRHQRSEDSVTLLQAVDKLDPSVDDHWSAAGKPNLMVLRQLTGQQIVRAEVDRVAGWMTRAYLSAHLAEQVG